MDKKTKLLLEKGESLPIMEAFYTIQGEGYHKGTASYFVRTGGCDIGCHWCDVKESWDFQKHPLTPIKNIVENVVDNVERGLKYTLSDVCNELNSTESAAKYR